jgi:hypothetical protein
MACPPEDCGGIRGALAAEVLSDPAQEDREEMLQ